MNNKLFWKEENRPKKKNGGLHEKQGFTTSQDESL